MPQQPTSDRNDARRPASLDTRRDDPKDRDRDPRTRDREREQQDPERWDGMS